MKNYYDDKKQVAYFNAKVEMAAIINHINNASAPVEVKRMAYIILRNESANGNSVVNGTNAAGVQSDSGRWPSKWDAAIVATTIKKGNREGYDRGFVVFDTLANCVQFLCERLQVRGMYIGGFSYKYYKKDVTNADTLAACYDAEWVFGNNTRRSKPEDIDGFISMYKQAAKLFK